METIKKNSIEPTILSMSISEFNTIDSWIQNMSRYYEVKDIILYRLSEALKMNEKHFNVPDVAYEIPAESFFEWYDKKLEKRWKDMTNRESEKYINVIPEKEIKEIRKTISKDKKSDLFKYAEGLNGNKIYFKIYEFSKLENDVSLLQKTMRDFLIEKSVEKMKGDNDTVIAPSGTATGRIQTAVPNIANISRTNPWVSLK